MALKFTNQTDVKRKSRFKKKMRIRKDISGTTERPRLSVFKSTRYMYVQLIDDSIGKTLIAASTLEDTLKGNNKEAAKKLGAEIAKRAKTKNIENVVFDRNGYRYHGKIKEVADAAREAGLKF
jgi:large subunit ribosomal protein L18